MKKNINERNYWRLVAESFHLLGSSDRPTPAEAAGKILDLMAEIERLKRDLDHAHKEEKCAKQQFKVFAMDVANIANKYVMMDSD